MTVPKLLSPELIAAIADACELGYPGRFIPFEGQHQVELLLGHIAWQEHEIALLENALRTLQIDFVEIGGVLRVEHGAP